LGGQFSARRRGEPERVAAVKSPSYQPAPQP